MNKLTLPKKFDIEILEEVNFFKQLIKEKDEAEEVLRKRNKFDMLPLPCGSVVDGALRFEVLPYIMSDLNSACDEALKLVYANKKNLLDEKPMIKYQLRAVFLECVHSLNQLNSKSINLGGLDMACNIIANKMNKIGFNTNKLKTDLQKSEKQENTEFYAKFLDNCEPVILSKGVVEKALLDGVVLDFGFIFEEYTKGNVLRGDFVDDKNEMHSCYILNTKQNPRMFLDVQVLDSSGDVFNAYAYGNNLKKLSKQTNKAVLDKKIEFLPVEGGKQTKVEKIELVKTRH